MDYRHQRNCERERQKHELALENQKALSQREGESYRQKLEEEYSMKAKRRETIEATSNDFRTVQLT
jgi:hypothetical protein